MDEEYKDLVSQYEDATNSPYAPFVPQPRRTSCAVLVG